MDSSQLDGKVAIVAGSGGGIGRAIATQIAIAASVAEAQQLEALVARTREAWGGIAVLLASAAGRYIRGQTLVAGGGMTIR